MLQTFAGGRLFGDATGVGPARVVALPGWQRTHGDFADVLAGLDAVALDLPGFGPSPPPPEPWGSDQYARLVAEALEGMADRVVVLGHSFGGRVAVHLAATVPDRVAGLVLTGAPLVRPPGTVARRSPLGFRLARRLHRAGVVSDARMDALREKHGSADYRAAHGVMRGVLVRAVNEDYRDVLGRVRCPVALVWGDDDTAAPLAGARELQRLLPGSTLDVRPGAGHLTPLTAAPALRAAIEDLLP